MASWTTPKDWATADLVTADDLDVYLSANTQFLYDRSTSYAILQDQKAAGTGSGNYTANAWTTRDLNTEVYDADGIVSIASNRFTPAEGTYRIQIRIPFNGSATNDDLVARLYNFTDTSETIVGGGLANGGSAKAYVYIEGVFEANGTDAYQVEYYAVGGWSGVSEGGWNMGQYPGSNGYIEIYTTIFLEKIG